MKPALTPEEWTHCKTMESRYDGALESAADEIGLIYGLRGVAAWALHAQPFGFTQDDVMMLRGLAISLPDTYMLDALADRIEALLPPKEDP